MNPEYKMISHFPYEMISSKNKVVFFFNNLFTLTFKTEIEMVKCLGIVFPSFSRMHIQNHMAYYRAYLI